MIENSVIMRKTTFSQISLGIVLGYVLFLIITCSGHSAQLSPHSKGLISEIKQAEKEAKGGKLKLSDEVCQKYLLREIHNDYLVHGIIRVDEPRVVEVKLLKLDVHINSRVDDLWSVAIPVTSFEQLSRTKGVGYIEIGTPVEMRSN